MSRNIIKKETPVEGNAIETSFKEYQSEIIDIKIFSKCNLFVMTQKFVSERRTSYGV